jgi:hypothetical protein
MLAVDAILLLALAAVVLTLGAYIEERSRK